jgi:hypothetical protein
VGAFIASLVLAQMSLVHPCATGPYALRLHLGTQHTVPGVGARWPMKSSIDIVQRDGALLVVGAELGHARGEVFDADGGTHRLDVFVVGGGPDLFISDVWRLAPCSDELTWEWPRGDGLPFVARGAPESADVMRGLRRVRRVFPGSVVLVPEGRVPYFEQTLADVNHTMWSWGYTGAHFAQTAGLDVALIETSSRRPPAAVALHLERDLAEAITLRPVPEAGPVPKVTWEDRDAELASRMLFANGGVRLEERGGQLHLVGRAKTRAEWHAAHDAVEVSRREIHFEVEAAFLDDERAECNALLAGTGLHIDADGGVAGAGRDRPFAEHLAAELHE